MDNENSLNPMFRNNFTVFSSALEYIEEHLCDDIRQEDIAAECMYSLSSLQKIWKYCTGMSLKEYITKRRLTAAGRELTETSAPVLDIAVKYGYNSHEVFTRAFIKVWGITPSRFRKEWKGNCGLYPRLSRSYFEGDVIMNVKKFDVSDFYDHLKNNAGSYVLCFDIVDLMPVNDNYGSAAGDKVILEAFRRINEAAEEDMLCLRIGGDEFAMVTASCDREKVSAIAEKVLSCNGNAIKWEEKNIPVSLRCGVIRIGKTPKYSELCGDFDTVINKARNSSSLEFI